MRYLFAFVLFSLLAACSEPQPAPESSSAVGNDAAGSADIARVADDAGSDSDWPHGYMAAVANPYATEAAAEILAQGGHAVDAAIAAPYCTRTG